VILHGRSSLAAPVSLKPRVLFKIESSVTIAIVSVIAPPTVIHRYPETDLVLACLDVPTLRAPLRRGISSICDKNLTAVDWGLVEQ
jgi:hypothetical protein